MLGAGREAALPQAVVILERLRAEPVRLDGHERFVSVTVGAATAAVTKPFLAQRLLVPRASPEQRFTSQDPRGPDDRRVGDPEPRGTCGRRRG